MFLSIILNNKNIIIAVSSELTRLLWPLNNNSFLNENYVFVINTAIGSVIFFLSLNENINIIWIGKNTKLSLHLQTKFVGYPLPWNLASEIEMVVIMKRYIADKQYY